MWLWRVQDYISFDEGHRTTRAGYIEFGNETQFETTARKLAEWAADEVARFRHLFPNVAVVANYYIENRIRWRYATIN
jgi:hypothetical protein